MVGNIFENYTEKVVDLASIFIIPIIKSLNDGKFLNFRKLIKKNFLMQSMSTGIEKMGPLLFLYSVFWVLL